MLRCINGASCTGPRQLTNVHIRDKHTSGVWAPSSADGNREEYMGDAAQAATSEISDLGGRAGESDETMPEGRSDGLLRPREDVSGVRQRAMRESVMMGLIIARVIECYASQPLTDSVSSSVSVSSSSRTNLGGDVSQISGVLEEGSGSGRLSLTGATEGQPSAVRELLSSGPVRGDDVQLRTELIDDMSNVVSSIEERRESDMPSMAAADDSRKKEVEKLETSPLESPIRSVTERGESSISSSEERVVDCARLVSCWFSPLAQRVAITLRERGLRHMLIEESTLNKNERTLNANPLDKKVPLLIHKGQIISEARIIMEYIEEVWPGGDSSLLPTDPFERSAARYWSDYIDQKIADRILRHIGVNAKGMYEAVNEALISLNKAMTLIPHGKSFFMGDRLGFVDISFAPMIPWFQALQKLDKYKIPDAQKCPRLHEWMLALQRHPSVKPSLQASSPRKLRSFIRKHYR